MDDAWEKRQVEMEGWYQDFIADRAKAIVALNFEYAPYIPMLQTCRGRVLDLGGGAGFAGAYLDAGSEYIVVDPSRLWFDDQWNAIAKAMSPDGARPTFVLGVGENLPFDSACFDAVVAFWSLNHASDPERCVGEVRRVLKIGGKALFVLEDMEPSWFDTAHLGYLELKGRIKADVELIDWHQSSIASAWDTAVHKLARRSWPLQSDHVRIRERDLLRWLQSGFKVVDRNWNGGFLSFELRRC